MSMTQNSKTVNVNRLNLIKVLQENLALHKADFLEAVVGYRVKLLGDLMSTISQVNSADDIKLLKLRGVNFVPPGNYEEEYIHAIEMLEASVDENINLDSSTFRAYFKNEWSWSGSAAVTNALYKSFAAKVNN